MRLPIFVDLSFVRPLFGIASEVLRCLTVLDVTIFSHSSEHWQQLDLIVPWHVLRGYCTVKETIENRLLACRCKVVDVERRVIELKHINSLFLGLAFREFKGERIDQGNLRLIRKGQIGCFELFEHH